MQKMSWYVKLLAWYLALGRQYKTIKETYGTAESCEKGCSCAPVQPINKGNG